MSAAGTRSAVVGTQRTKVVLRSKIDHANERQRTTSRELARRVREAAGTRAAQRSEARQQFVSAAVSAAAKRGSR